MKWMYGTAGSVATMPPFLAVPSLLRLATMVLCDYLKMRYRCSC